MTDGHWGIRGSPLKSLKGINKKEMQPPLRNNEKNIGNSIKGISTYTTQSEGPGSVGD